MRITESQLRKIVREEAKRLQEASLPGGVSSQLTIRNVSKVAGYLGVEVGDFEMTLQNIAAGFRGRVELSGRRGGSIGAVGSRRDLEDFVSAVEGEVTGYGRYPRGAGVLKYDIVDL